MDFAALMAEERAAALEEELGAARAVPDGAGGAGGAGGDADEVARYVARPFGAFEPARDRAVREEHELGGGPGRVWYVPDWVSEAEEAAMLAEAAAAPEAAWTRLRRRALQCWGGQPSTDFVPERLPGWLDELCGLLAGSGVFDGVAPPNHVLLNRYAPGEGIAAHKDGPLYAPVVAILSLGAPTMIDFFADLADSRPGPGRSPTASVLLRPRSLVVFSDDLYTRHWHEIDGRAADVVGPPVLNARAARAADGDRVARDGTRISLTCRHVPPRAGRQP